MDFRSHHLQESSWGLSPSPGCATLSLVHYSMSFLSPPFRRSNIDIHPPRIFISARSESRTRTSLRTADFESAGSTIPPPGHIKNTTDFRSHCLSEDRRTPDRQSVFLHLPQLARGRVFLLNIICTFPSHTPLLVCLCETYQYPILLFL